MSTLQTAARSIREDTAPLVSWDLGHEEYQSVWKKQKECVDKRVSHHISDTIIVVEHDSVFTAGKRTEPQDRPVFSSIPVCDVDRGGKITWHGPGQLVMYPIVKLRQPLDVVRYVRRLELALMSTCSHFGVPTCQIASRSGVWVQQPLSGTPTVHRKIAAIGIRVSRGVAHHGIALNCNNSLEPYTHIVPCGLSDAAVTSLSQELSRTVTIQEVKPVLLQKIAAAFDAQEQIMHEFPDYQDR